MSELYDIGEIPEGMSPITFDFIDQYQCKDFFLMAELKCATY